MKAERAAGGKGLFVAAARDRWQRVAHADQRLVELQQRSRVSALQLHVVGRGVRRDRPERRDAFAREAGVGARRPAHRRADRVVRVLGGVGAGQADLFAVVDERRAGQQQVARGGESVLTFVALHLVPQARAGKVVVVGDHRGHAGGRGDKVVGHKAQRVSITAARLDGLHDVRLQVEAEGAAAQLRQTVDARVGGGLAHHVAAGVGLHQLPQLGGDGAAFGLVVPLGSIALHKMRHRVEPEAVDAPVEPEAQAVFVIRQHRRIAEIEVRHVRAEGGEVVAAHLGVRRRVPRVLVPDRPPHRGLPLPHVPVAIGPAARRGTCREHRVLGGTVIDHVVGDHANAALMGLANQFVKVGQRAVVALDGAEVGGGVAMVAVGALLNRHQPQALDAQVLQIVKPRDQAAQITDAIAVAVLVRANKDFHERAVLPMRRQRVRRGPRWHGAAIDRRGPQRRRQQASGQSNRHEAAQSEETHGGCCSKRCCDCSETTAIRPFKKRSLAGDYPESQVQAL